MKKVSTVAVEQSRNNSQRKLTAGLDLGTGWHNPLCGVDTSKPD